MLLITKRCRLKLVSVLLHSSIWTFIKKPFDTFIPIMSQGRPGNPILLNSEPCYPVAHRSVGCTKQTGRWTAAIENICGSQRPVSSMFLQHVCQHSAAWSAGNGITYFTRCLESTEKQHQPSSSVSERISINLLTAWALILDQFLACGS